MAISDEDIFNWFLANPDADDATIASTMNQFDLTPEDIARATGSDISDVQSRYDAVTGSLDDQTQADTAAQLPTFTDTITSGGNTTEEELLSTLSDTSGGITKLSANPTAAELLNLYETSGTSTPTTITTEQGDQTVYNPIDYGNGTYLWEKAGDIIGYDGQGQDATPISADPTLGGYSQKDGDYINFYDLNGNLVERQKWNKSMLASTWDDLGPIITAAGMQYLGGIPLGDTGLTAANAVNAAKALESGNVMGVLSNTVGAANLPGIDVGGYTAKDALNAVKLATAIDSGNVAGILSSAGSLTGSSDLRIAGAAAQVLAAADSGNYSSLFNAATNLARATNASSASTSGKTTVTDAGTDTNEDVTLPGGIQLASLGDGVFRTDVGGTPTYAESKNAGSVTTPFGYSLLSATEADNKPEGSYYDPTANAWFKPDTSLADLAGGSTLQADLDLFTGSQGDLDQIAASTAGTSDDATADFLASIGITNSTQLADSGLSNSDILDLVNADTDTSGGTGDITGGNITDTTGLDTGDVIPTGDDVPELVVTGDKTTNTDTTTIDTITGGDGNDLIVDDKGEVVIKDKKESCPIGTVLNPETGECDPVEDKGEVVIKDKKESCPIGTVLNPETGECDPVDETLTCPPGKVLNDAGTACIDEVIIKDKKDFCPVGTVLNPETGECDPVEDKKTLDCPEGYEPNDEGTACIPVVVIKDTKCDPGYVYDEDLKQCVPVTKALECPEGFHLSADGLSCEPDTKGKLECPEGYEPNDDGTACIPVIEIKDKKCDPGYVYDEDLKMCVPITDDTCPVGFHKDDSGTCVPDEVKCETGYHLENGVCVPDKKALECPEGYELNDAGTECIPVVVIKDKKCDPGYVYDEDLKQCVPIKDEGCAEGFHLENGICVPDDDETCKDGYEKVNGVCVPVCKEGYVRNLETGTCEKVEDKSCPAGQVRNADGKCVPIVTPPPPPPIVCPTGYRLVNGACVPIPKTVVPTMPTSALGESGEKTDPIYAGGMDEFNLLATLQELLKEEAPKKDDKKSKDKTKMATGGHLDDLLAEQMTVDDLLKLLR